MKLYILGNSKDDKGTQLEQLTTKILEYQGYTNILTNVQVSGASEIDVTARKMAKTGIKEISTPVICECKAHEKPIVMTDWLKFIGKLYIARKTEPGTVGLMLALSGANGAVIGSATNDFNDDAATQLIANDDIIILLSHIFDLLDIESAKSRLMALPIPRVIDINLVYYNYLVWWIVECENGHFTLCHSDLKPATLEEANAILSMIPNFTIYQEKDFFDVWQNMETGMQIRQIQKSLLSYLLINGSMKKSQIYEYYKEFDNQIITEAMDSCKFFKSCDDNASLSLSVFSNVELYRFILDGDCPIEILASDFYQDNINNDLLEQIWIIQGGFRLPSEMMSDCLQLLKFSPSALRYALKKDRVLSFAHMLKDNKEMTELYNSHFMGMLQNAFKDDFRNPVLSNLYYNVYGVMKMQICTSTKVYLKEKNNVNINVKQNYTLVKLDDTDQAIVIVTKDDIEE